MLNGSLGGVDAAGSAALAGGYPEPMLLLRQPLHAAMNSFTSDMVHPMDGVVLCFCLSLALAVARTHMQLVNFYAWFKDCGLEISKSRGYGQTACKAFGARQLGRPVKQMSTNTGLAHVCRFHPGTQAFSLGDANVWACFSRSFDITVHSFCGKQLAANASRCGALTISLVLFTAVLRGTCRRTCYCACTSGAASSSPMPGVR